MTMRTRKWLGVLGLALLALSCAKLPEPPTDTTKRLQNVQLPSPKAIPMEFGKLVSVTYSPFWDDVFELWFENEEGAVHLVLYDMRSQTLVIDAWAIPRT
jgi:hypothetical protein